MAKVQEVGMDFDGKNAREIQNRVLKGDMV